MGETAMRLGRVKPRSFNGEKRWLDDSFTENWMLHAALRRNYFLFSKPPPEPERAGWRIVL